MLQVKFLSLIFEIFLRRDAAAHVLHVGGFASSCLKSMSSVAFHMFYFYSYHCFAWGCA